LFITLTQFNST